MVKNNQLFIVKSVLDVTAGFFLFFFLLQRFNFIEVGWVGRRVWEGEGRLLI